MSVRFLALVLAIATCSAANADKTTVYYLIQGKITTPSGAPAGNSVGLARRTVDRQAGKVEEAVISLRDNEPAAEFVTTVRPTGNSVKITDSSGGFSGVGRLFGKPWDWNRMTFHVTMTARGRTMTIDGEDHFRPNSLETLKMILGPDNKLMVTIHETGTPITQATYETLRSRLLKKG